MCVVHCLMLQAVLLRMPVENIASCLTVDLCDSFLYQALRSHEKTLALAEKHERDGATACM